MTKLVNTRLVSYDIKIPKSVTGFCRSIGCCDSEMQMLVANMVAAIKKNCTLVYSRVKGLKATSRRKISVYKLIKSVDRLCELGYATTIVGVASPVVDNRVPSTLTPTQAFIDLWQDDNVFECDKSYINTVEKVVLRDERKQPVMIKKTGEVMEIEETVSLLNDMNEQHEIVDEDGYRLSNLYCRVFNVDFNHGGRFYRGEVLNIDNSNHARLGITIDGENVVEIDYSGLHIRIAAAEAGVLIDLPDDPYSVVTTDPSERKLVKLATNIMLNCRDKRSAIAAINSEMRNYATNYVNATQLFNDIVSAFAFIGPVFCREDSYGLYLQSRDSELASMVMKPFIEMNAPILPVHDSFITKYKYNEMLQWSMGKSFRELFDCDLWVPVTMSYRGEDGKVIKENLRV